MFHYTIEIDKSTQQAIELLKDNLKEEQFGVLWEFDVQKKLQAKGLEFNQEYYVLEVCNPQEAQRILNKNQLVGYFLPCKIVVYNDQGKTKIGLPKPTALIELVDNPELTAIAENIEERLINCINKSC
ncbi:DUF302 domain-containing protein [Orenia marismortui]|uniref:Uncharacterized protein (DUF302 family) n=1 Tax=Orenia marismortui TaxID=46469 RepID=A0A4R8GT25_9FIRM|nr:DUF302 domain-containing protein [Orenia marismortui]TDX49186.1 uncharacterized protein (DUF302 family) [Orenia marismortui]